MLLEDGLLLRVYVGEADQHADGPPLYQWLLEQAHARKLMGATVLRGLEGYGASSRIHTARVLRLSTDLPVIVEIMDRTEAIESFMQMLDEHVPDGVVSVEKIRARFPKPLREA